MKSLAMRVGLAAVVLGVGAGRAGAAPVVSYTYSLYDPAGGITFPTNTSGFALTVVPANAFNRYPQTFLSQNGGPGVNVNPGPGGVVQGGAVNDFGQVAGIEGLPANDASNLFVRTPTPGDISTATFLSIPMERDLQGAVNPFVDLFQVNAINDQQFILATGHFDPTGQRNFGPTQVQILLTPSFNAPEPGTLGAALTGAVLGGFYLKRRSRARYPGAAKTA